MNDDDMPRRLAARLLHTPAGRAAAAAAWAEGHQQKAIARAFGLKTASPVCEAIAVFVGLYTGMKSYELWGEGRRRLVAVALAAYCEKRREAQ